MKLCKKNAIIIVVVVVIMTVIVCLFFWYKNYRNTEKIIENDCVKIEGMWVGSDFCFTNQDIINSIVDCVNSAKKCLLILPHTTCESPDSALWFTDKNGDETILYFYGNYMRYGGKQYKVDTSRMWHQEDLSLYTIAECHKGGTKCAECGCQRDGSVDNLAEK